MRARVRVWAGRSSGGSGAITWQSLRSRSASSEMDFSSCVFSVSLMAATCAFISAASSGFLAFMSAPICFESTDISFFSCSSAEQGARNPV